MMNRNPERGFRSLERHPNPIQRMMNRNPERRFSTPEATWQTQRSPPRMQQQNPGNADERRAQRSVRRRLNLERTEYNQTQLHPKAIQDHGYFDLPRLPSPYLSINDRGECGICQERPANIIIKPCRHLTCCEPCFNNLRQDAHGNVPCPMCREPVTGIERIMLYNFGKNKLKGVDSDISYLKRLKC
jgi:hypothetical protein